ncbi:YbfB/YjiJ family MFS transporter [Pseudoroseomonas cervicalis]|uniref:YbfB/YjiJ family MFS transporter n=2 Tax=Teichococcus cervicalis TaxID=204525 RepID=UPI0022F19D46|nr:YbfB/YjiJ family MFS transporter [Pseudoroseomonas cervicalis]WBV42311.1 YbfB/YjiJ family MFS transporter [Pseudoroseomonas cervicalis]
MSRAGTSLATALAGAGALCVGIGLARFAYVPIFPAMVAAGWADGGGAGLLGACNFSGYLAGALGGRWLGRRLGVPRALDAGMALAALSFLACALHWGGVSGLLWLALWRALAGVAGGVLMGLAGPSVQAVTPPEKRGAAGGVVVSGVGAGVVLGALAVPALRPAGVEAIWLGLAALTLLLWLWLRPRWPDPPAAEVMRLPQAQAVPRAAALMAAYGLSAAGMAAPMVYLADLGARGHGLGPLALGALWALFGLGGVAGTLLGGRSVGRIGGRATLLCWLSVQVAALLAALGPGGGFVLLAALLGGFSGIGISAVALGAVRQLSGVAAGLLWVRATALYALAQALTGFVLAALFRASGDSHALVFAVALGLSVLGLLVALRVPRAH